MYISHFITTLYPEWMIFTLRIQGLISFRWMEDGGGRDDGGHVGVGDDGDDGAGAGGGRDDGNGDGSDDANGGDREDGAGADDEDEDMIGTEKLLIVKSVTFWGLLHF